MTQNINALIDRKIQKLRQLQSLLADPEMAELVQTMFASKPATGAASQQAELNLPKVRKAYQRQGGSLIEETYRYLREWGEPATAKDLADFMQSSGYNFKAKDRHIAVSKALRQLAVRRIKHKRGDHAKAPIIYWVDSDSIAGAMGRAGDQVPVQETTQ
jgi:hypothetical protein